MTGASTARLKHVLSRAAGLAVVLGTTTAVSASPAASRRVPVGRVTQFEPGQGVIWTSKVGELPQDLMAALDGRDVYVDAAESHTVTAGWHRR